MKNKIFKYDFLVDQNYKELNYNELGSSINFDPFKIDFSYLLFYYIKLCVV